jgi:hypothetical protein
MICIKCKQDKPDSEFPKLKDADYDPDFDRYAITPADRLAC